MDEFDSIKHPPHCQCAVCQVEKMGRHAPDCPCPVCRINRAATRPLKVQTKTITGRPMSQEEICKAIPDSRLIARTNAVLVGLLRHYGARDFGTDDVCRDQVNAMVRQQEEAEGGFNPLKALAESYGFDPYYEDSDVDSGDDPADPVKEAEREGRVWTTWELWFVLMSGVCIALIVTLVLDAVTDRKKFTEESSRLKSQWSAFFGGGGAAAAPELEEKSDKEPEPAF